MADLELRELRYFRAVAEELNFSRAAERLAMTQPPLSRAIRQLERRLGSQLFERDSRRVALTPAGEALLAEARHVLDAVITAVDRTRRAARRPLVVTAKPGVATDLLREHVSTHRLEVAVSGFGDQIDMVRTGRADVALVGPPLDYPGLEIRPLLTEPRVAAIAIDHALAGRDSLSCRDLADLPFPQCPGMTTAERHYWTLGRSGPAARDSAQVLEHVALGQAVALVPTSLAERNVRPDIVYRPVPDASDFTLAAVWRPGAGEAAVRRFVDAIADPPPRPH